MKPWKDGVRWKATAAAVLLVLTGSLFGVLVDRLWLLPREVETMPLSAQAMAARLDLSPVEEARINALLDSMHVDVTAAAQQGPDSLLAMARSAHRRLEAALPPRVRPEFRVWMQEHHRQMMERAGGTRTHGPTGPEGRLHHEDR